MNAAHIRNNEYKGISCHSCGLNFTSKPTLMDHRKEKHSEIIKKCRYFVQGNCSFQDSVCWYRHGDQEEHIPETRTFECSLCEEIFQTIALLMAHKRENHAQRSEFKCRDFVKGTCRFNADICWYSHGEESMNVKQKQTDSPSPNSVFQKGQVTHQPPDLIQRIISMMEKVMEKVEHLEKSVKLDQ